MHYPILYDSIWSFFNHGKSDQRYISAKSGVNSMGANQWETVNCFERNGSWMWHMIFLRGILSIVVCVLDIFFSKTPICNIQRCSFVRQNKRPLNLCVWRSIIVISLAEFRLPECICILPFWVDEVVPCKTGMTTITKEELKPSHNLCLRFWAQSYSNYQCLCSPKERQQGNKFILTWRRSPWSPPLQCRMQSMPWSLCAIHALCLWIWRGSSDVTRVHIIGEGQEGAGKYGAH